MLRIYDIIAPEWYDIRRIWTLCGRAGAKIMLDRTAKRGTWPDDIIKTVNCLAEFMKTVIRGEAS